MLGFAKILKEKTLSRLCSHLVAVAFLLATINANSTCVFLVHQEEVPKSVKKLCKR